MPSGHEHGKKAGDQHGTKRKWLQNGDSDSQFIKGSKGSSSFSNKKAETPAYIKKRNKIRAPQRDIATEVIPNEIKNLFASEPGTFSSITMKPSFKKPAAHEPITPSLRENISLHTTNYCEEDIFSRKQPTITNGFNELPSNSFSFMSQPSFFSNNPYTTRMNPFNFEPPYTERDGSDMFSPKPVKVKSFLENDQIFQSIPSQDVYSRTQEQLFDFDMNLD